MKRQSLSKRVRFSVFARDNFTCRYCGKNSISVVLVCDHIVPVAKGGSNEEANLVTSCEACNQGKGVTVLSEPNPSTPDRLAAAQELAEQTKAAQEAARAAIARADLRQTLVNYWCGVTGRSTVDRQTVNIVVSYVSDFGMDMVCQWIDRAAGTTSGSDNMMGRYISGIRRSVIREWQDRGLWDE